MQSRTVYFLSMDNFTHRHSMVRTYREGEHAWHYRDRHQNASHAILILRYGAPGTIPYAVCAMDTRSNPRAEQDAELLCTALNTHFAS